MIKSILEAYNGSISFKSKKNKITVIQIVKITLIIEVVRDIPKAIICWAASLGAVIDSTKRDIKDKFIQNAA